MNMFTNDDYRRIQAWLKANAIKDSDFAISEDTVPDEDILVITQNMSIVPTNYKIKIKDLLNSSLGKVVIDKITANVVKVNNILTVDASKVILNNEKGTTLQDVLNYFEEGKLNRHTDDTFDGNLTIKKDITIEGNIKSDEGLTTVEENLEATGEITDGHGNQLNDVNSAAKNWRIEYQDPAQDEPTVRAKYVLKDYKGVPKGNVIKVYKDSAITNVYLGTTEDTCNPNTGEVTKYPTHDNNEALSIVYRLDTGKYMLVNVPIGIFTREVEFDKYRGLGITENGQVFIKLASDVESSNYLHFNDSGEVSADGIENRILQDLGTIINSVAGDGTMWGQYKKEEGTKDSPINEISRWGQYKQAEANRSELLNTVSSKVNQLEQEQIQGGVYDVSSHNNGAVFDSLSALLSSSNLSTLIPTSVRHGGMSIRFIQGSEQSSDNKYVQYRLTDNVWSTNIKNWQGVDDEPIAGSDNLVKSGGIVKLYGGKVDLQFETIQSVYLAEDVPFIAKKGDTINFQLNALNLIDNNGITIRLLKNENIVQSSYANNTSWISALLTSDIDTIRVTRSANGIIGTGTASLSVKYENPFYTKEETNALISGIQSSMIISKQDDNTKATEKIIQNNQVVAEYGKQIDIFRFASGGSAKREFNVTSDNRRFTINFPIIKDRKYRIVFSGATSSAAYNIQDAADSSTVIFGGDAYSTSIAKFTAQNSYENTQIYFSSSMLFPQVISMDIFDITNEGLSEDLERVNKKVIGDIVDISSLAIPSETAGFYTGGVGGHPQFTPIVNSIAYNPIDLTEYVGNKVKVSLQNPIDNSERYTLICDSDEISTAVIGQLISEDEIYEYGEAVFDITEKYKYLWISNRNDSGTVTIKVHQEATLKSEIEKEILNDIDQTINNRIAYVSPNGSDTNDGKTENTPVKTINKALSLANKIRLLEGVYVGETVNLNSYPYNEVEIKGQDAKKVVIDFKSGNPYLVNDGSETLVSGYTKVYQVTCNTFPFADGATNAFMWQDYVNDQNTLITEQDRHPLQRGRQYRCDSTKIKQVASIAAIEALSENEFGWYWENGIMYFSRPQISSIEHPIVIPKRDARFIELQGNWIVRKQIKLTLNNIEVRYGNINISYTSNCELADVLVKYPYISNGGCFYIYAATNCKLIRCEAAGVTNGESIGDGFNVDTAGTADNATCTCLSLYMRDCWAHDIWDDGYSDHDNSEVTIDGGLFEYCGKGGLTPSYGSNDVIKNAVCRYNRGAGILATGTPQVSRINTNVLAQNCLCYGQQYGFKSDNGCNLKCISCLSKDNKVGYGGAGKVYCYDCSSSDDVAQKDSNVVVLSFNKISS